MKIMKIAMFNATPSEEKFIKPWENKTNNEIKVIPDTLNSKSVDEAKGCDGITVLQTNRIADEEIYQKLHDFGIKSIGLRIVGTNIVDFDLAKKYELQVTHVPVYSPRAIAEMAVTQAMYLLRKIGLFHQNMDENHDFSYPTALISDEIFNQTVGIIGAGHIGSAAAQIYSALGAKVIAYDPVYNPEDEPYLEYTDFDTVIKESDIISLHTPLNDETKNMIGAKELAAMKDSAYLINCARGGLIDTAALIEALQKKEIAGAGLDTLAEETTFFGKKVSADQVGHDYKILDAMPNVIITPHSAYFTKTAVKNMFEISLRDTIAIINGQKPLFAAEG